MGKKTIFLAICLMALANTVQAQCSYSAYVDFGLAMTNGRLDLKENVFRSSGLRKNLRSIDSSRNFRAVYTANNATKSGDFEIVNIGPFDTEAVAISELNSVIRDLEQKGYKPKKSIHSMPAVIVRNERLC